MRRLANKFGDPCGIHAESSIINIAFQNARRMALCTAAADGDADECLRLLAEGADPNVPNKFGLAALALACTNDHIACVRVLLNASADPNTMDAKRVPVLSSACDAGRIDVCQILLETSADVTLASGSERRTALHNSSRNGRSTKCLPLLLSACSSSTFVNAQDYQNTTALALACRNGHADAADRLLRSGADPLLLSNGQDAIALARQSTNPACVRVVLAHMERSTSRSSTLTA
jgi:ankyrin repeat protein